MNDETIKIFVQVLSKIESMIKDNSISDLETLNYTTDIKQIYQKHLSK